MPDQACACHTSHRETKRQARSQGSVWPMTSDLCTALTGMHSPEWGADGPAHRSWEAGSTRCTRSTGICRWCLLVPAACSRAPQSAAKGPGSAGPVAGLQPAAVLHTFRPCCAHDETAGIASGGVAAGGLAGAVLNSSAAQSCSAQPRQAAGAGCTCGCAAPGSTQDLPSPASAFCQPAAGLIGTAEPREQSREGTWALQAACREHAHAEHTLPMQCLTVVPHLHAVQCLPLGQPLVGWPAVQLTCLLADAEGRAAQPGGHRLQPPQLPSRSPACCYWQWLVPAACSERQPQPWRLRQARLLSAAPL